MKVNKQELLKHLEYEYKLLAEAAIAWDKERSAIVQDSLLLHTRNILLFFSETKNLRDTDIHVSMYCTNESVKYFYCKINNDQMLKDLAQGISVHVLHLTYWRDPIYRNTVDEDPQIEALRKQSKRPIFDNINHEICPKLLRLLKDLMNKSKPEYEYKIKEMHDKIHKSFNTANIKAKSYNRGCLF
ncbi:hypothetical protein KC909_05410 [Candidatus Dojkabacteria bacterium]|uniref:Uncharacterized protein n=1 Tax=Candidatus Dojkabacteria bacterium TaxID=2099670 RepID=A0A955L6I9_9BACT|nr:hypothetical protein [Candidatus Dojkabacteria bacterium]